MNRILFLLFGAEQQAQVHLSQDERHGIHLEKQRAEDRAASREIMAAQRCLGFW